MKSIITITVFLLLILTIGAQRPEDNNKKFNTELSFKSSYPEGYGVVFRKEEIIKKIVPVPNSKFQKNQYYLTNKDGNISVMISGFNIIIDEKLDNLFKDKEVLKIKFLGYETISSLGMPSCEGEVKPSEVILPADIGWRVSNLIYIIEIEQ